MPLMSLFLVGSLGGRSKAKGDSGSLGAVKSYLESSGIKGEVS